MVVNKVEFTLLMYGPELLASRGGFGSGLGEMIGRLLYACDCLYAAVWSFT